MDGVQTEKESSNVSTSFEHDRVISLLEKSGCLDQHFKVQDCMVDNQDWRKCQIVLKELKDCVDKQHKIRHQEP